MPGMIQLPMHITLQYHACQEGTYNIYNGTMFFVDYTSDSYKCSIYIFIHVCSTHKVVGVSTISRSEHTTAQTREYECTRSVLPQVMERGIANYVS